MKTFGKLLFDRTVWCSRTGVLSLVTFLSLFWFIIDWCSYTTFRAMSDWMLYTINGVAVAVLMLPWLLSRKTWLQLAALLILDLLFMSNLMYCRTYLTAIPPESYSMVSNVGDFTASVWDSLRWLDLGFAVILTAGGIAAYRTRVADTRSRAFKVIFSWGGIFAILSVAGILCRGGFYKEYDRLVQSCYYSTCGVPTYTIAGHIIYCELDKQMAQSPEQLAEADEWLEIHPRMMPYSALPDSTGHRRNMVLIICESLESWLIGSNVGGKEITPYLNSLIADSTSFYIPNVLTQVGSGRSSDAFLLLHTGLLPMVSTVYSMKYPYNEYPTLNKALEEQYGTKSSYFSCDKPITWNLESVARSFGYKNIFDRRDWEMDELIGNPAKLSDGSFLRQSVNKIKSDSTIWPVGEPAALTFITYSGHSPFKLPGDFKDPDFDISGEGFPERLEDYITMAHYTDSQLHTLIDYVKSRPDYDETLIVIVGDHEGLAGARAEIVNSSEKAADLVSAGQYTPLLILNSPVTGRFDEVIGQVDVYPTLMNLLGTDDYYWKGLGQSAFAEGRINAAISTMTKELAGDTTGISAGMFEHISAAHRVSDAIIRNDHFRKK